MIAQPFVICVLALLACASPQTRAATEQARGYVFKDLNHNGNRDAAEPGIPGVAVSNGYDVVLTGEDGAYRIPVGSRTILFITQPTGYRVPLDENNLPRFFYIHYPSGTPPELGLRYPGVEPTGPLPESIDFPLTAVVPLKKFEVILLADPQPQTAAELGYVRDDLIPELIRTKAAFGITLGDIMFDDLALIPRYNRIIAEIGIPWYNVPGNHELNFLSPDNEHSLETFKRYYGPSYYSFDYGDVHFVALDTVNYLGMDSDSDEPHRRGKGSYEGSISDAQLTWLANDLAHVPTERPVVIAMHVPLMTHRDQTNSQDQVLVREPLLRLLQGRDRVLAIAGHSHTTEHHYLGEEHGFSGAQPLHSHVLTTVSGSWWSGPMDDRGIPTTHQTDGTPNGYHVMYISGDKITLRYKAAGYPAEYQMRITLDTAFHQFSKDGIRDYRMGELLGDRIDMEQLPSTEIVVNLFDGGPRSKVEYRIGDGPSRLMTRAFRTDPFVEELYLRNSDSIKSWVKAEPSSHVWTASLPPNLEPGVHTITVRATDEYGQEHLGHKLFELVATSPPNVRPTGPAE